MRDDLHEHLNGHPRLSTQARALLSDVEGLRGQGWLYTSADAALSVVEPGTGRLVGSMQRSIPADVRRASKAARAAFDGGWGGTPPAQRSRLLHRLADLVESQLDALTLIGTLEGGTPVTYGRMLHAAGPLTYFRWWADQAAKGPPGGYEESLGIAQGPPARPGGLPVMSHSLIRREPLGVVAAIIPYNAPLLIAAFKVGGALAAGCTCVLMPSARTPLSAIALLNLAREAGLPPGVLSAVIGEEDIGRALTTDPDVSLVSFTGSVGVGRMVGQQAMSGLKRVVLELGGKSPNVLLPGARVDEVIASSMWRYIRSSGQGCGATTRTIVPRSLYDEYVAAARDYIAQLVVGDPWDEKTHVGPVIRGEHRARIEGYVERALAQGGRIEAGGGRPPIDGGFFLNPSLVGQVGMDAEICQEELFGPVGVIVPYDSVEEALALANNTRFGLNANVWGRTDEAYAFAGRVRSGTVTINGGGVERPEAPWAGYGDSSVGSDRGYEAFREFFLPKHIQYPLQ